MDFFENIFSDKDWRDDLDPEVTRKLEKLLKRIKPFEKAYKQSDDEAVAQLWVALAEVFIQVEKMNRRLLNVERLLTETQQEEKQAADHATIADQDLSESLQQY